MHLLCWKTLLMSWQLYNCLGYRSHNLSWFMGVMQAARDVQKVHVWAPIPQAMWAKAAALGFSVKVTRVHFWTATGLPGGSCPSHYASRALFPLELVTDKEDLGDPHAHLFCLLNQPPPLPPCEEVAPRMIRVDAHVYPATGWASTIWPCLLTLFHIGIEHRYPLPSANLPGSAALPTSPVKHCETVSKLFFSLQTSALGTYVSLQSIRPHCWERVVPVHLAILASAVLCCRVNFWIKKKYEWEVARSHSNSNRKATLS